MKKHLISTKKLIAMLVILTMVFSLIACGGNDGGDVANEGPEGTFENTEMDGDDGDGFQPVDEFGGYGLMTFNSDGTGKWQYALETDIEWKLKGDKLTIVESWEDEENGPQEETYEATWDGENIILDVWGLKYLFEKTGASDSGEKATDSVDSALVGTYKGTGSDMQGTKLDPNGEWLKLNADGTGEWFLGITEDTFTWEADGNEINFKVDVANSDNKMPYTATVEGDKITLDTAMLYYFTKGDLESSGENQGQASDIGWGYKPNGKITIPSDWYGVAIFTDCEGFDFKEAEFDIWGSIGEDSSGTPYFELWNVPNGTNDPILSMYIDKEDSKWLTPRITDEDAWISLDPNIDREEFLTKDHEWALMTEYVNGSLDIFHTYTDDQGGSAECRFFVREKGTGWDEEIDPLPPGYEEYKASYSSIQ